ncbi:hypothetical protein LZ575_02420 [Antarcticibacterium sp. 1MA-6-2]|uniref:hypothetical protein n=1 Tax=Antarcticibacterium sp. 1MA-6-2 TaxID=2908210 RepID=UPI001F413C6B|nr:hypothetical protein [Antarcticibacterium sp. 1MA-6-2]UJH91588.1 hypothetical protein LZ575_02420 [Antarcticibacterium sp. 1MA-6-2]
MAAYLNSEEVQDSLDALVKQYVEESINKEVLPQDFVELIKHNFFAKYAYYNVKDKTVEIGVNENSGPVSPYPPLTVYSYPIEDIEWLSNSFKQGAFHLEFYGKLLSRSQGPGKSRVVFI